MDDADGVLRRLLMADGRADGDFADAEFSDMVRESRRLRILLMFGDS